MPEYESWGLCTDSRVQILVAMGRMADVLFS
jgi:hypothetical protein